MNGPAIAAGGLPFDPSRPLVRLYAVVPAAPCWESTVYGPPGQMALTRGVAAFALMSDGVKSWLEPLHASGASRDVTRCHD